VIKAVLLVATVVFLVGYAAVLALLMWGLWRLRCWGHGLVDKLLTASANAGPALRPAGQPPSAEVEKLRRHDTNSARCWCGPELRCFDCDESAPCIHGTGRSLLVLHRQAS
jgi:hypothetical protein